MRVPSGSVNKQMSFVATDATDFTTRETGLSSFTVYRSRNGGAPVLYTTPTVTELSAANMPGVYTLLIDEDTTITAGVDEEPYVVHITHAGMAPVSREIELYRPKSTEGEAVTVASGSGLATLGNTAHGGAAASFAFGAGGTISNGAGTALEINSTSGVGLRCIGTGSAAGIRAEGGASSGPGAYFFSAGGNGPGMLCQASGTGTALFTQIATGSHLATNAITADTIAADAIGASELAADAVTEIQSGLATASALATVDSTVNNTNTKIGAPVISVASDIATVSTKIGSPAISLASDHTALATASALSTVNTTVNTLNTKIGTPAISLASDHSTIFTRLPAALVSGRMDASVGAMATDVLTAAALATDAVNEIRDSILADSTPFNGAEIAQILAEIQQLVTGGAATNTTATSYVLTTGTQSSGTVSDTVQLDGTAHQHTDTAGAMELYYEFDLGADGIPTQATATGRLNGSNDTLLVYAYNWTGASWDQIGTRVGQPGSGNTSNTYTLFTTHVGTGANEGLVRIRYFAGSGLSTATLHIDQIFVSYTTIVAVNAAVIADAIWDEAQGDHVAGGSFGESMSLILADTNELQTDDVPGLIAALNNLSASQVNDEVRDVMATDTLAESTGVPAANASAFLKLAWLATKARNLTEATSSLATLYADDGVTPIATASLSDNGTTAQKGEWA